MDKNIFPPGWELAEDISQASTITTLTAGGTVDILTIKVPSGARLFIEGLTARVIDAGSDQITFQVLRNGMSVAPGLTAIPGVLFDYTGLFTIQRDVGPGDVIVQGVNSAAASIRAVASLKCYLLRQAARENTTRYVYEANEVQ